LHHNGNLMVSCWQVAPDCDCDGWRTFRVDRICALADGDAAYVPRRVVDLTQASEFVSDFQPPAPLDAVNEYFALA
jgi:hypothetical protein